MSYALDITNLSEEPCGDVSQRIHELMGECLNIVKVGDREIGMVAGNRGDIVTSILKDEGYNVNLYHGCGHCLQGMEYIPGICQCECHN